MRGAGASAGAVRLIRVSLTDCDDHEIVEVCGAPRGAVTDPPLYDPARRIAVAYDSANGIVQAYRFDGRLTPIWRRELDHAAHMILYPDTGELVVHDFHGPALARTRAVRAIGQRFAGPARSAVIRRALARFSGDDVVVLDIETGDERARARVPSDVPVSPVPCAGLAPRSLLVHVLDAGAARGRLRSLIPLASAAWSSLES